MVCLMAFILVACGRNTEQKKDSWVVTQYGDQSGKQGMFYTIYNEKKDVLVVVDGGWKDNTELVRSVIHSAGGHVTAWIVKHYHPDHVEALNEILMEPDGIVIDAIYDSPMDHGEYLQVAKEWDSPETFQTMPVWYLRYRDRKRACFSAQMYIPMRWHRSLCPCMGMH